MSLLPLPQGQVKRAVNKLARFKLRKSLHTTQVQNITQWQQKNSGKTQPNECYIRRPARPLNDKTSCTIISYTTDNLQYPVEKARHPEEYPPFFHVDGNRVIFAVNGSLTMYIKCQEHRHTSQYTNTTLKIENHGEVTLRSSCSVTLPEGSTFDILTISIAQDLMSELTFIKQGDDLKKIAKTHSFFSLWQNCIHLKQFSRSNTPPTSSADSSKDSFTQISPGSKKEINSTKSSSESDDEDDSHKLAIVFSYKENQPILEDAVWLAKVPEQEKALIKIITATGEQSPIQQRFIATQPNPITNNGVLTNKPLRTRIKPLATPREQKIERDYSPKYTAKYRRRNPSKSPSCSSYSNHRSQYEWTDQYYHEKSQYHTRTYDYKQPHRYRQHQHPYEQPQGRSAHLRLDPQIHHYSRQSSRESSRAPATKENDDINMDQDNSTSNRPLPIHPATTSTTKQLMTTSKIFRSTPPTWRNFSNTKRQKDKQSTFKNQQEVTRSKKEAHR